MNTHEEVELFKLANLHIQNSKNNQKILQLSNTAILIAAIMIVVIALALNILSSGQTHELSAEQAKYKTGKIVKISK